MKKTCSFRVSGRVQGVFFRQSAREQARLSGLTGWIKNLPDGSVVGQATGDVAMLSMFQAWLRHGPDTAKVLKLECEETELQFFDSFRIH